MRGDEGSAPVRRAEGEAAFDEAGCKVRFTVWMHTLTVVLEDLVLFPSAKVRDVGRDKGELAAKDFGGPGDALGGDGELMRGLIGPFIGKRTFEQRGKLGVAGLDEVSATEARVDEASQDGRLFE